MEEVKITNSTSDEGHEMSMEELLRESDIAHLAPGDIVDGTFVGKTSEGYLFDIGHKREALVPAAENLPQEMLSSPMKLRVINPSAASHGGNPILSWKAVAREETAGKIKTAFETKTPISGVIVKTVKGGYIVDIGTEAFMPGAHTLKKSDKPVGRRLECLVIDMKDSNVVVSERLCADIIREKAAGKIFSEVSVGNIVEGTVVSITKFGAFVDIGGLDGLIHITDVSWRQDCKIEDFLKIGKRVKTKVLAMDPVTKKISLGLKQTTEDPWKKAAGLYSPGDVVECTVRNIAKFGVFCELAEGVDGLLHVSEVDWETPSPNLAADFPKGTRIKAKILSVDIPKNKISLSLKRLKPSPWEKISDEIAVGKTVEATVLRVTPFGAVLRVGDCIDGTLHVKNLDWFKKISNPGAILKTGQKINLYVLEFEPEKQRLELSLKHLKGNPFERYKRKTVVDCTVKKIFPAGASVEIEDGIEAFVPRAELTRKKNEDIENSVKVGDKLRGVVMESDATKRKIDISVRKFEIEQEKRLLAKYSAEKPGPRLEDLLNEA